MHHGQPIRVLAMLPTLLASGVAAVLGQHTNLRVEHRPRGAADAAAHDVLIADLAGGLATLDASPGTRVLILSARCRESEVCDALQRGVHGYLLDDCSADELVAAVLRVAAGGRAICDAAAERLAESLANQALTAREAQVLELLALGLPNKAIARELALAIGTVQAHMKVVLGKLGASTRTEAVSIAHQRGLLRAEARPVRHAPFAAGACRA